MKKIIYTILVSIAASFAVSSCSNEYLNTSSPSVVDANFVFSNDVTARAAMYGVYEAWRSICQSDVFGDGLYYALDVAGSDIERHPEPFANQPGRHWAECLYQNGTYTGTYGLLSYQKEQNAYTGLYDCISKANAVITAMENSEGYAEWSKSDTPSKLSQLYGEAICARSSCYRELVKYYGDVPFATVAGVAAKGLAPRDSIYECVISDLERVIPLMYRVGETGEMQKNIFSRTFAEGMIGRICLDAAGYQTRRADLGSDFYKDGKGSVLSFETLGTPNANAGNAVYGRRSDWKSFVAKAKLYFKAVIDNQGSAVWHDTDPRSTSKAGQEFGNPYQYFFQQMNDLEYADESIYEYAMTQGKTNDARPYSYGRPSSGGGSNRFPCKNYGQGRENPAFYWGVFDPQDMRRDVSICITGSKGDGSEVLLPFAPGSKTAGGGLSLNKWDENRMAQPYCLSQRKSGINGPYMRLAEIYLGYAEACAANGDDGDAKTYLAKVRERSFPKGQANTDAFITSCGSVYKAVIQERGFEFAGEGDRRWTLIRSGLLPEAIKSIKTLTAKMIDGLSADGYYTFANGNTISNYIWTMTVNGKAITGHRLTTQTPEGLDKTSDEYATLFPGWRGQNDDWEAAGQAIGVNESNIAKYLTAGDKTNLAVQGIFNYIAPDSAEAKALEARGYKKTAYASNIVKYAAEYLDYLFYDYDYTSAPIYLMPYTPNIITTGGFTNGYGFRQN